jgi:hypothetical protein
MTLKLRDGVSAAETDYGTALLDGGTPAQAVQELTAQYTVDAETASRDVEDLVGGLHSAGLVEE